jgi:hypothetical protein
MSQILFNLQTSEGSETHTLTKNGTLVSEFSGLTQRRWIPDLPDLLQSQGFLGPAFALRIRCHLLSNKHADLLGVPSLRVLENAKGTQAIAIISRPLDLGQVAAVFQLLPHLIAVTHGPTLTLAPPPTVKPVIHGTAGKTIPASITPRPCKPAIRVGGNFDESRWP